MATGARAQQQSGCQLLRADGAAFVEPAVTRGARAVVSELPLALPEIMLGINQTILLALSMLIIAAMVGTRDLGQEVFIALADTIEKRELLEARDREKDLVVSPARPLVREDPAEHDACGGEIARLEQEIDAVAERRKVALFVPARRVQTERGIQLALGPGMEQVKPLPPSPRTRALLAAVSSL